MMKSETMLATATSLSQTMELRRTEDASLSGLFELGWVGTGEGCLYCSETRRMPQRDSSARLAGSFEPAWTAW